MTTEVTATAPEATASAAPTDNAPKGSAPVSASDFDSWLAKQESKPEAKAATKEEPKEEAHHEDAQEDAPKEPAPKIWKLKVNGKDVEFDASNEERIKAEVQKGIAAQEKFQQAATIQKQAEQFIKLLQTNPEAVLSNPALGVNLREFAENYLYKQIQQERMTPEEKEAQKEQARIAKEMEELEQYRNRDKEQKQQQEQERLESLKENYRQEYAQKFMAALQKVDVPEEARGWAAGRMAEYMKSAIKQKMDVTPDQIAEVVKQELITLTRTAVKSAKGQQVLDLIGDSAEEVRKHYVEQASRNDPFRQQPAQSGNSSSKEPKKPQSRNIYEFMDKIK